MPGAGPEFEEVPFHEFVSELKSGSLRLMTSAQLAIKSVRAADVYAEQIDGRERLKLAQTKLVKILSRMEKAAKYSVFKGIRKTLDANIETKAPSCG